MDGKSFEELLKEIELQEKELVFDSFTMEEAYALGTMLYEDARTAGLPLAIDITRNGQQLYHAALPGTTADNDQWIIRKSRVVNRFGRSSFYIGRQLAAQGKTIEEKYHVSSMEFSPNGGSFPIQIRNVGPVGTVTVSGLPEEEDHAFLTGVLRKFLGK